MKETKSPSERDNKADKAKAKVDEALSGFIIDWESHLKAPREFNNPDSEYSEFTCHGNLKYHLDQFTRLQREMCGLKITDDIRSKILCKLADFEAIMRPMIKDAHAQGSGFWDRKPDSYLYKFDALLKDITDIRTNLDDYF